LVGGFAASNWLFTCLQVYVGTLGLHLSRPDGHLCVRCLVPIECHLTVCRGKAVADGAVSFFLDRLVTARVARVTYGVEISSKFDPNNAEHVHRSSTVYTDVAGEQRVPRGYSVILAKVFSSLWVKIWLRTHFEGSCVSETTVFRHAFSEVYPRERSKTSVSTKIISYEGNEPDPRWLDVSPRE